ncbi:MAG: SpoIIE family protein phosphatase [Christensenellales bacterium]
MAQANRIHEAQSMLLGRTFGKTAAAILRRSGLSLAVYAFCLLQGRAAVYPNIAPFGMAALCACLLTGKKPYAAAFGVLTGMLLSPRPFSAAACVPVLAVYAFYRYIGPQSGSIADKLGARRALLIAAPLSLAFFSGIWGIFGGYLIADIFSIPFSAVLSWLLVPMFEKTVEIFCPESLDAGTDGKYGKYGKYIDSIKLTSSELVVVALPIGALLLGITDIRPFGRSPGALAAALLTMSLAYSCGAGGGAALGAILGAILSAGSPSLPAMAGSMALCGLACGAFRDMGKGGSACAYLAAAVFSFWQSGIAILSPPWPEMLIAAPIFLALPNSLFSRLGAMADNLSQSNNELYHSAKCVRTGAMLKLSRLLPVFASIESAYAARESAPLDMQSVCAGCRNEHLCHGQYSMHTVKFFRAAAGGVFSDEFREFCLRWEDMREQITLVRIQRECCKMIGRQIKAIGEMIGGVARSFAREYEPEAELTRKIRLAISDTGETEAFSVSASREDGLLKVDVACLPCGGCRLCDSILAPVISECAGVAMQCLNYGCISKDGVCRLHFEPVENLNVIVGVSRRAPLGEKSCGDSYAFGRLDGGRFYVVLSDGMGSGADANELSQRTVALVEDYLAAGLEPALAVETANRYMSSISRGKERYATLDLHCFSLFDGSMEYVKMGACHSYILSGGSIKVLKESSLPLGLFDELAPSSRKETVASGDMLIVISDGICDCAREDPDLWMDSIRGGISRHNPQFAAEYILRKAQEKDSIDDRTVLAVRIT